GFDDRTLPKVKALLEPLKRAKCPFAEEPELNAPTTWVEPKLVAEVSYQSWTDDERLRAPVFVRMREDLDPKKVNRGQGRNISRAEAAPKDISTLTPIDEVLAQLEQKKAALTLLVGPHKVNVSN